MSRSKHATDAKATESKQATVEDLDLDDLAEPQTERASARPSDKATPATSAEEREEGFRGAETGESWMDSIEIQTAEGGPRPEQELDLTEDGELEPTTPNGRHSRR